MVQALVFYFFSAILIGASVLVIASRNPVHSVLFLIVAFFQAAGLFILAGAEFLAMIVIIVYVGAIAVLFLFVVMMLDINFARLRAGLVRYLPIGAALGLMLVVELVVALSAWTVAPSVAEGLGAPAPEAAGISNTHALGRLIYTDYVYLFQAAGIVLLIAMIGAIVLTLRHRPGVHRQSVTDQVNRRKDEVVAVRKVANRGGL